MTAQSPIIGILSYGAGNTGSVQRALSRLGIPSAIVTTAEDIATVNGLIFPGAGAARAAMENLERRGLVDVLRAYEKPFLGLCLGMQLLFDASEEGPTGCLGIIPGRVRALLPGVTTPHMGWNRLSTGDYAYFVHSYCCEPADASVITMTARYGSDLCAGVRQRNFLGLQWHPETSGATGDRSLLSFASLCK
ncbi:MAG: imidazole glycerol phosphate synthase subunit HisH [Candidatus Peribacteraceae bacterium]|jgi:glutamine amidotransferase